MTDRDLKILNLEQLRRYTLGDLALESEVLGLFADQAEIYVNALVTAKDEKSWREAAHSLRGSAAAIGAQKVVAAAVEAEQFVDFERREDLLSAVRTQVELVRAAISRHVLDPQSA